MRLHHGVPVAAVQIRIGDGPPDDAGHWTPSSRSHVVVVAPSNPLVSIGPIRALPGIDELLVERRDSVVAVSPIVGGAALKGPADRMLVELGHEPSVVGVARLYAPIAAALVIDPVDADQAAAVEAAGMRPVVVPSIMRDEPTSMALARATLNAARSRPSSREVHGAQARWMRARTGDTAKRVSSSGRAGAAIGSGPSGAISAHRSRSAVCTPGADVDDQPAAPPAGAHEGVDDVVDEDEVPRLPPVAGEHRWRPLAGRRARAPRPPPPSGRWRGPYTVVSANAVNSMPCASRYVVEQVDDRLGDHAAHASGDERPLLDRQLAADGWPYSAVAGSATTTLPTPLRRAASRTASIEVNDWPSSVAAADRGSRARW